ncbi:transposase [Paraburkholderia sp. JPY432]|uniref:IS3 family transposase n=1 Tax=Paraburkholderia youngii TaxID=2782701 RepID=UPI001595D038|nr:IS3 family transposase [Paraburkholderia youngii]NVH75788.1 transposase [Paraburkholderia youngii]
MTERAMGVSRACGLLGISRSLFHYESRRRVDDEPLTGRMMAIAAQKRGYSYRRIHMLLQRDSCFANHKRIWRLYSKALISVRKRRRKRDAAVERTLLLYPLFRDLHSPCLLFVCLSGRLRSILPHSASGFRTPRRPDL